MIPSWRNSQSAVWTWSFTIKSLASYYSSEHRSGFGFLINTDAAPTVRTQSATRALRALPRILSTMQILDSFSFTFSSYRHLGAIQDFFFRRDDVRAILEATPKSVRHLELDTFCYDREGSSTTSGHLCHTLREMLPRLLNLRLRLAYLCPELIPRNDLQSLPKAGRGLNRTEGKTIIINTISDQFVSPTSTCGRGISPDAHKRIFVPGRVGEGRDHPCLEVHHLRTICCCKKHLRQSSTVFSAWYPATRITLSLDVHRYQKASIDYERKAGEVASQICGSLKGIHSLQRCDEIRKDTCGGFEDVAMLAEGQVWVETTQKLRLPTSYLESDLRLRPATLKKLRAPQSQGWRTYYGWVYVPAQERARIRTAAFVST